MKTVWILMSIANDYNQPEKAFEKLWWFKPTHNELKQYGFTKEESVNLIKPNRGGSTQYWVESFTEN